MDDSAAAMDRPAYITDADWDIIKARFEKIERKIDALQKQADAIGATCLRVDEIVHAHQPFIDRVRAQAVGASMATGHTFAQELSDAVLALRQMSSAVEDLVRRVP